MRYNSSTVNLGKLTPDKNGFLQINKAYAARAGVLKYRDDQGNITRELLPPEELFKKESMDTLSLKPVSVEHSGGILNSKTVTTEQVGATGDTVGQEGDFLTVPMGIHKFNAVQGVVKGDTLELSAGYNCDVLDEPGVYEDAQGNKEPYDKKQVNVRHNHLTLTERSRDGKCGIRLNSGDAISVNETQPKKEESMKIIQKKAPSVTIGEQRFNSESFGFPEEHQGVFDDMTARTTLIIEAGQDHYAKLEAKFDTQAKELEKEKLNSKGKEGWIDPARLNSLVEERAENTHLAKSLKLDIEGKEPEEARKMIAEAFGAPKEKLNSSAYVEGIIDANKGKIKGKTFETKEVVETKTPDQVGEELENS